MRDDNCNCREVHRWHSSSPLALPLAGTATAGTAGSRRGMAQTWTDRAVIAAALVATFGAVLLTALAARSYGAEYLLSSAVSASGGIAVRAAPAVHGAAALPLASASPIPAPAAPAAEHVDRPLAARPATTLAPTPPLPAAPSSAGEVETREEGGGREERGREGCTQKKPPPWRASASLCCGVRHRSAMKVGLPACHF